MVVEVARERRREPAPHVVLPDAVLVPERRDERQPELAENARIDVAQAVALDGVEPDELEVEVVVGQHLAGLRGEALDVLHVALALVGRAHGAADVLADPAGVKTVFVVGEIEVHWIWMFFRL